MKIEIKFESEAELKKKAEAPVVIKSLKDLRKLLEKENPRFSYGGVEFGALPSEKTPEELSEETSEDPDVATDAGAPVTPDDKAEVEDAETRIKNSKFPTIVGKKMR